MQVMKDKASDRKEKFEDNMSKKLRYEITSSIVITYRGLLVLKKIVSTYQDLTNDVIVLTVVMTVLNVTVNFSWDNFVTFPYQGEILSPVLKCSCFMIINFNLKFFFKTATFLLKSQHILNDPSPS